MQNKKKIVKEKKVKVEEKKVQKTTKKKPKKKRSKAFTLIELLAVIIILGILMIIAIPSVTTYISNSRKSAYIDTVKEVVGGARTLVNSGKLETFDQDTTYYIPTSCIATENGLQTPYGKFSTAYIVVTYTGDGYDYYFTGTDTSKTGIKTVVPNDLLNEDYIESDIEDTDILLNVGVDGRSKIDIFNEDCTNKQTGLTPGNYIDNEGYEVPIGNIPGHQYYNANLNKYYGSFQEAINEASTGNTIKVMGYVEEKSTVTIPESLSRLKIDFNDNTIYFDWRIEKPIINNGELILINSAHKEEYPPFSFDMWSPVVNNGTIEVNDYIEFRSENDAIENYGTVNVKGGHVFGYDADGIVNYGVVNVSGGEVNGYSTGIRNQNIVNITGGTVSGYHALGNCETCTTNLSGNGVISGHTTAVGNSGTFIANGGTIRAQYAYTTTGISNSGNVILNNITIETSTSGRGFNTYGIINDVGGTITFNSGTLKTYTSGGYGYAVQNAGTFNFINGEISATTSDYHGLNAIGIYIRDNGVVTIHNGVVKGANTAIEATDNYTLTLGDNDGSVSTTYPEIYGTSINGIGMRLGNSGVFNFYDGIIKYARGVSNCINGTPQMNLPQGYVLHKEFDNPLGVGYLVLE